MHTQQVWEEFSGQLLQYIQSKINSADMAEDILQDVFMKIHKHSGELDQKEKLANWLYSIARNAIIDHYRKKKLPVEDLDSHLALSSEPKAEGPTFSKCIHTFIKQLPEESRTALELTAIQGYSQKEFAQQEGIAYSTAKSRVQRARVKLKELFLDCCAMQADKYGNILSTHPKNKNCHC